MIEKIRALYAKHGDILRYVVIGGFTTLIDIVAFALLNGVLGVHYMLAKVVSWVLAVTFAFIGNKWVVFRTQATDAGTLLREIGSFVAMRLISLAINAGLLFLAVDVLGIDANLSNIVSSIIVIIVNYFLSKLIVFRKRKEDA